VLYMLGQKELAVSKFPMGEFRNKAEARRLARDLGLHLADKPDSQEICFVSEAGGYREFLRKARPEAFSEGEVVDEAGELVGAHAGLSDFTVGQRRGIGVSGRDPLYVLRLEPTSNRVVVGPDASLLTREVPLEDLYWPSGTPHEGPLGVMAKIRYNMAPKAARLYGGDSPRLEFREPVRAVTPGQIAVAYRGATVLAGGTIRR
jgi:tRNA-uridine 2-sulfurtransferase